MNITDEQAQQLFKKIRNLHPKISECSNGHIGLSKVTTERENDDDRESFVRISRCSHCKLPDGKLNAVPIKESACI